MYIATLQARITGGTKFVEIGNVFDSEGNPVIVRVLISRTNGDRASVAIDAPKSVSLRQKEDQDGMHADGIRNGNNPMDLDGRDGGAR